MPTRLHTDIETVSKLNVASSGNEDSSRLSLSAGLFWPTGSKGWVRISEFPCASGSKRVKNKRAKPQPRSHNLHMKTSLIYIKMNLYAEHRVEI